MDHCRRAIKLIDKEYEESEDLMREVNVLKGIQQPCITDIVEVIDSPKHLVIVMEFAAGGEFFDQVVKDHEEGKLQEHHAKIQFFQIAHTMVYPILIIMDQ